jgi:hypothetical protein
MCKSAAEGGQRCITDAREYMEAAQGALDAAIGAYAASSTPEAFQACLLADQRLRKETVGFASTHEGAKELREKVWNYPVPPLGATPEEQEKYHAEVVDLIDIIDEGALLAQRNREVENAYRASQGKPPVRPNHPVPLTHRQEADLREEQERAAAAKAAKEADPFGLRTERSPQSGADRTAGGWPVYQNPAGSAGSAEPGALACGCRTPEAGGQRCNDCIYSTWNQSIVNVGTLAANVRAYPGVMHAMAQFSSTPAGQEKITKEIDRLRGALEQAATRRLTRPETRAVREVKKRLKALQLLADSGAMLGQRNLENENKYRAGLNYPPRPSVLPQLSPGRLAEAERYSNMMRRLNGAPRAFQIIGSALLRRRFPPPRSNPYV